MGGRTRSELQVASGCDGLPMIVCGTTAEYRKTVPLVCQSGDFAVEVGSAHGVTCRRLAKRCATVIGIDSQQSLVKRCQESTTTKTGSQLQFHHLDVDNPNATLQALNKIIHPRSLRDITVLYVDLAGTNDMLRLLPILTALRRAMRPRITVVKNTHLCRLISAAESGAALLLERENAIKRSDERSEASSPRANGQHATTTTQLSIQPTFGAALLVSATLLVALWTVGRKLKHSRG